MHMQIKTEFINFLSLEIKYNLINDDIKIPVSNFSKSSWNYYPTYQEYESMMQAFADSFPNICKLHNLGTLKFRSQNFDCSNF